MKNSSEADDTARIRSDNQLALERDFGPALIHSSPAFFVAIDARGKTICMNASMLRALDYSVEEVEGADYLTMFVPERERASLSRTFGRLLSDKKNTLNENHVLTRDGSEILVEWHGWPIFDADGEVERFYGIGIDITKRREAEEALKESQAQLQALMDTSPIALSLSDTRGNILYSNNKFRETFGYTLEDMPRVEQWYQLAYPDPEYRASLVATWEESVAQARRTGGNIRSREVTVVCKDGSSRDVEVSGALLPDRILAVFNDITRYKRAEQELRLERDRAQTYLDIVGAILVVIDADQNVRLINKAGCRVLGCDEKDVLGRNWFDKFVPEGYRNNVKAVFDRIIIGERELLEFFENPVITGSGEEKVIAWHNTVLRDDQGQIVGTLSAGEDITERKNLEDQLRQSQKMDAVGQLAGGVAHDFNNLLQVIQGYGEMAYLSSEAGSPLNEQLRNVMNAAERATDLVQQLLAFSRKQLLELRTLDLNDVVADLVKFIRRIIGEDIRLEIGAADRAVYVNADRGQLEQVLMNLCVNSRAAMPDGGRIIIETEELQLDDGFCRYHTWARPGQYARLTVSDTGHGMTDDTKQHIFEPFFTTKEPGEGTGLGLSTVFGIIRQHSGMINVYSEPGEGTSFRIYLPTVAHPSGRDGDTIAAPPAPGGTEMILLAEDDAAVRKMCKIILEQAGYTVVAAENGEAALRLFETHSADLGLAVLDVVMPKLGGRAVFDRIQTTRPDIPVLFTSGYTADAVDSSLMARPDVQFISKPYKHDVLLKKVRDVIDSSRS